MAKLHLFALLPLAACSAAWGGGEGQEVAASGAGGTRTYAVAGFTAVDLRGFDDVDVRVGPAFSVRAEGDPRQLDELRIERVGDTLRVGRRDRAGRITRGDAVRVHVMLPRLAGASVSGSGDLAVDRVEGPSFAGAVAGSGTLAVASLTADQADLNIAGSGDLTAAGEVKRLKAAIAGSGDVAAPRLTAATAEVSVAGSGNVRAAVDGPASVSILGSGDVDLGPTARCTTSKMGSGTVRCGG